MPTPLPIVIPSKKDRPVFMAKTSDAFGLFHNANIESHLRVIIRKLTEKCLSAADFMMFVRRVKLSNTKHISPAELRHILVKFGVTLPQNVVDEVFVIFDDDRSGSIDLDEFISMMMNNDAMSILKNKKKPQETDIEKLRKKFLGLVVSNSSIFAALKRKVSYVELIALGDRLNLPENEIRAIYLTVDPKERGYLETDVLLHWAKTGNIIFSNYELSVNKKQANKNLIDAINTVTCNNPNLLLKSFAHVPKGYQMRYEEFQQALLSIGLGKGGGPDSSIRAKREVQQLFNAAGGSSEYANIDAIVNEINKISLDKNKLKTDPIKFNSDPIPEPMKIKNFGSSRSNTELRLREYLRKDFKHLKAAIEQHDSSHTGFIAPEALHKIINKHCGQISYADFCIFTALLKYENNLIDWKDFVLNYNPVKNAIPHDIELEQIPEINRIGSISMTYKPKRIEHHNKKIESGNFNTEDIERDNIEDDSSVTTSDTRRKWKSKSQHLNLQNIASPKVIHSVPHPSEGTLIKSPPRLNPLSRNSVVLSPEYPHDLVGTVPTPNPNSILKIPKKTVPREIHGARDYVYNRDLKETNEKSSPYWKVASVLKDDPVANEKTTLSPLKSSSSLFSLSEKSKNDILMKYDPKLVMIFNRFLPNLMNIWREVRSEFKRNQSSNGLIKPANFVEVLNSAGINLPSDEFKVIIKTFNRSGNGIKYDDFLRTCLVSFGM